MHYKQTLYDGTSLSPSLSFHPMQRQNAVIFLEDRGLSKHIKTHCLPAGYLLVHSGLVCREKWQWWKRGILWIYLHPALLVLLICWTLAVSKARVKNPQVIYSGFIKGKMHFNKLY